MVTNKKNFGTPHVVKIWSKSAKINFFQKKLSYPPKTAVFIVLTGSTAKMASYTTYKKLCTSKTWKWEPKRWAKIRAENFQNMALSPKNLVIGLKMIPDLFKHNLKSK